MISPPQLHSRTHTHGKERCPICKEGITPGQSRWFQTCNQRACRQAHRQRTIRDACIHERRERQRQREAENQRRYEHLHALARTRRASEARAYGIENPESYRPIVLPANQRCIVPLSRHRRYRFAGKLNRLIQRVDRTAILDATAAMTADRDHAAPSTILAEACALCRGSCCKHGHTHAYLDMDTIQDFSHLRPHATLRDVVAAYCHYLPNATYENSCVFHAEHGCALPWDMRSKTCRHFLCGALVELHNRTLGRGETCFFLAASTGQAIVRTRFCGTNNGGGRW